MWLLVIFVPGRNRPGMLDLALRKHGLQFVEGCEEPEMRARYGRQRGLVITLAEWEPVEGPHKGAVRLPEDVIGGLLELAGLPPSFGEPSEAFEVTVLRADEPSNGGEARISPRDLEGPLVVGRRYVVRPLPPSDEP